MKRVFVWYIKLKKYAFSQLEKCSLSILFTKGTWHLLRMLSQYVAFKNGQFLHNIFVYFVWVDTCLGNFHSLTLKHLRQLLVWLLLVYVYECTFRHRRMPFPCFAFASSPWQVGITLFLNLLISEKDSPNTLSELIWLTHCVQQWEDCNKFCVLAHL